MNKDPLVFINHILASITEIEDFAKNTHTKKEFLKQKMYRKQ